MNKALSQFVRPHYLDLKGYVSAGMEVAKTADKIFMNANENPYELPGLEGVNRYPQPQPAVLCAGYAQLYGVKPEHVAMTRGADEAIVLLFNVFCEPHKDSVVITSPTFGMYARSAVASSIGLVDVPYQREAGRFALDIEGVIAAGQQPEVKLVFLCSPNNPTGEAIAHADIRKICQALEGYAVVVLDETYAEFAPEGSMAGSLEDLANLIILRTLSKSYALAGARMGSMLCGDADFIDLICAKAMDAYPLPVMSIYAAIRVLAPQMQALAQENMQKMLAERDRLRAAFEGSSAVRCVYPSDANFLLVEMEDPKGFLALCASKNIILRDFSDKPETKDCLRISPSLPEHNDLLIACLSEFEAA